MTAIPGRLESTPVRLDKIQGDRSAFTVEIITIDGDDEHVAQVALRVWGNASYSYIASLYDGALFYSEDKGSDSSDSFFYWVSTERNRIYVSKSLQEIIEWVRPYCLDGKSQQTHSKNTL